MPVRSLTPLTSNVFVPPDVFEPFIKVKITTSDSTEYEVADSTSSSSTDNQLLNFSFTPCNTRRMGNFELELNNNEAQYLNVFSEGDVVQFYLDYTDGTTLRFRGKVDNVYYSMARESPGFTCTVEGRQYPEIVDNETLIIQFDNTDVVDAIKGTSGETDAQGNYENGILYGTGLTWSDSNTLTSGDITTKITKSYQNKSAMFILTDVCVATGVDFYLFYDTSDSRWEIRVFEQSSITNSTDYIAQGINLRSMNRVGIDNTIRKNEITVYGKEDDNIILLKTSSDTSDISSSWTKSVAISDSSLATMEEVDDAADKELAEQSNVLTSARVDTYGLLGIKPGERITVSIPYCGVNGYYRVESFTVDMDSRGDISTSVNLERWDKSIAALLRDAFNIEQAIRAYKNLNAMTGSFNLYFDSYESGWYSLSNCEITDGVLKLSSGQTTGTLTTATVDTSTFGDLDSDVTHCELRIKANQYTACTYRVSNNNGVTWETVTPGVLHEFDTPGDSLRLEITLNEPTSGVSPEFASVVLLYK